MTLFWQMRFEGTSAGERFFILWKETVEKMFLIVCDLMPGTEAAILQL